MPPGRVHGPSCWASELTGWRPPGDRSRRGQFRHLSTPLLQLAQLSLELGDALVAILGEAVCGLSSRLQRLAQGRFISSPIP